MSTGYTHFDKLAFNQLFAIGPDNQETLLINSSGVFVGIVSSTGTESVTKILVGDGLVSAPSISFNLDTDTGIYRAASNQMMMAVGGIDSTLFTQTYSEHYFPVRLADGLVGAPSLTFKLDTDTGFFRAGANSFTTVANGAAVCNFSTAGLIVTGAIASSGSSLSITGKIIVGQTAGLGTSAAAYQKFWGSIVAARSGTTEAVFAGNDEAILAGNLYRDGSGTSKAIKTITGYSMFDLQVRSTSGAPVLTFKTNYQDAQTADTALTTTNEITQCSVTAAGAWSLVPSGGQLGFFGVSPASKVTTYNASNVTTDRTYDANSTSIDELADVLGTLIADLRSYGLLG